MFDYDRYDHTYCRILRDGDEVYNRKRKISTSSNEKLLQSEQKEPVKPLEKENGTKREPVIIVRTKRPRKTAPVAEVMATVNISDSKVDPVTDIKDENKARGDTSVDNSVTKMTGKKICKTEKTKMKATKRLQPKNIKKSKPSQTQEITKSKTSQTNIEKRNVEIQEVTKSGRVRKLTKKAIEGKSPKKPGSKKSRLSQSTNVNTNVNKTDKLKLNSDQQQRMLSKDGVKPTKSKPSRKSSATKSKNNRLVVVMKPMLRQQSKNKVDEKKLIRRTRKSNDAHSIPAAKIDISNIVQGSRRRKK